MVATGQSVAPVAYERLAYRRICTCVPSNHNCDHSIHGKKSSVTSFFRPLDFQEPIIINGLSFFG